MTDAIQHIDVDSDEFLDTPKALRDHVKKLQASLTRANEQVETLRGQATASALGDVLKEFKNPERVKRDLLAEKIDPLDPKAVETWLAANGDDYAKGAATPSAHNEPGASVDQAEIDAHQRIASAGEFRQDASMSKLEAAKAEITPDMTGDQIIAVYKKHGV